VFGKGRTFKDRRRRSRAGEDQEGCRRKKGNFEKESNSVLYGVAIASGRNLCLVGAGATGNKVGDLFQEKREFFWREKCASETKRFLGRGPACCAGGTNQKGEGGSLLEVRKVLWLIESRGALENIAPREAENLKGFQRNIGRLPGETIFREVIKGNLSALFMPSGISPAEKEREGKGSYT